MPLKRALPAGGGAGGGRDVGTGSVLDKRLGNPAAESGWNIATLKANLQEDSAMLEMTLREANKLLVDINAPPLVDIGGVSNKDRLRGGVVSYKTFAASTQGAAEAEEGEGTQQKGLMIGFRPSADFLREMDVSKLGVEPKVVGFTANMSEECSAKLNALEALITKEGVDIIRKSVKSDIDAVCRTSRSLGGGGEGGNNNVMGALIEELESRIADEEMQKNAAIDTSKELREQTREHQRKVSELQDKLDYLESSAAEGSDEMQRMELEMNSLRDELNVSQNKMHSEESDKLRLMERGRKRDLEVAKMKETMDKMTWQLRALGEERDHMHQLLEDTKTRYHDTQAKLHTTQEELSKHQNAERVMKRNLQMQMPEEIKRVVKRVEELEKMNRDLTTKLGTFSGTGKDPLVEKAATVTAELNEIKINYKQLEGKYEKLRTESEAAERRFETNLRLAETRSRSLFDKTVMYTQKLQGATDTRVQERLSSKSSGNELTALRRQNMDLRGKLIAMEEEKLKAEKKEQEAEGRCVTLQEKIDLFAMIQRIDISNLSYSSAARTEDDVDRIFMQRSGMIPRLSTGQLSRGATPIFGSRSRSRAGSTTGVLLSTDNSNRDLDRERSRDGTSQFKRDWAASDKEQLPPRAQSAQPQGSVGNVVVEARAQVGSLETEALHHKLGVLQAKVGSEEKARLAAQERVVSMAEQLLEKEKEISNLQHIITTGDLQQTMKAPRQKLSQNDKSRSLALKKNVRDVETEMQKVKNKLSEKEEECRIKARKISELLFKLQVEEDSNLRIHDQVMDLTAQIKKKEDEVARLRVAVSTQDGSGDSATHKTGGLAASQATRAPSNPSNVSNLTPMSTVTRTTAMQAAGGATGGEAHLGASSRTVSPRSTLSRTVSPRSTLSRTGSPRSSIVGGSPRVIAPSSTGSVVAPSSTGSGVGGHQAGSPKVIINLDKQFPDLEGGNSPTLGVRQLWEQQEERKPQTAMPAAPAAASSRDPSPVPPPTFSPPRKGPGSRDSSPGKHLGPRSRDSSPGKLLGAGSKADDGPLSLLLPIAAMEGGEFLSMITE